MNLKYIQKQEGKIKIEFRLKAEELKDSGKIYFRPLNHIYFHKHIEKVKKPKQGRFHIDSVIKEIMYTDFSDLLEVKKCGYYVTEPGDSVTISSDGNEFEFSGQGAEKYQLQYLLYSVKRKGYKVSNALLSTDNYFENVNSLRKEFELGNQILSDYKFKISQLAFETINSNFISEYIGSLTTFFHMLRYSIFKNKQSNEIITQIYDSCYLPIAKEWLSHAIEKEKLELLIQSLQLDRVFKFDSSRVMSDKEKVLLLCNDALKIYKGFERECLIVNFFSREVMGEMGFRPEVEKILMDYYSEPDYPELKAWMKEREIKTRERFFSSSAPDFSVVDLNQKYIRKADFKGRYAVLCFVRDNEVPVGVLQMKEKVKDKKNIDFVIIPCNNDANSKAIHDYAVINYPTVWIMHPEGNVINSYKPKTDFVKDQGKSLTDLLIKEFSYQNDGPYVYYNNKDISAYYINKGRLDSAYNPEKITVQTDQGGSFSFSIKRHLHIEPTVYIRPEKLIAFSDIEGNFDALRKLLQENKVIDENFKWIYGKGHMVFMGDMFDRGRQVTECLWLLYSIEEQAKAAGGYVHFILGNHEVMNLQGNHKYVVQKYRDNAKLMGRTLTDLYNGDTELGRWLRTKNIVEKIGDLLFVHGGISMPVFRMNSSLSELNALARPYLSKYPIDSADRNVAILFGSVRTGPEKSYTSPFWFRGYWGDRDIPEEIPTMQQVDSTLRKFDVKHIIAGHTLRQGITSKYNDKIINTDTPHASGISEALLMDGNEFYKVNAEGQKSLLFKDGDIGDQLLYMR